MSEKMVRLVGRDERSDFASPTSTAYRYSFDRYSHRVRVECQGITLAVSDQAMVLWETRLPPVFYFPREHVRIDLMQRTAYRTHCPFKGNAAHFSLCKRNRNDPPGRGAPGSLFFGASSNG
ncbi:MAG: DUF427 domain-containing protein [Pseudomonadota bacterium]|nr:DUF427 domain-containing protein [Pseudomonadota bacterium]